MTITNPYADKTDADRHPGFSPPGSRGIRKIKPMIIIMMGTKTAAERQDVIKHNAPYCVNSVP